MYGDAIRRDFAKTYAKLGNATASLTLVLGIERAGKMQPHTLRAKASELLNDYRTVEMIEQYKAEMAERGEVLPHYRGRTSRTDLIGNDTEKDPPVKAGFHDKHFLKVSKQIRNITARLEKRFKSRF